MATGLTSRIAHPALSVHTVGAQVFSNRVTIARSVSGSGSAAAGRRVAARCPVRGTRGHPRSARRHDGAVRPWKRRLSDDERSVLLSELLLRHPELVAEAEEITSTLLPREAFHREMTVCGVNGQGLRQALGARRRDRKSV